ncbi:hypothetical protein LINGRAHAP2_LOCUS8046, partial [Linum grandiflorum]
KETCRIKVQETSDNKEISCNKVISRINKLGTRICSNKGTIRIKVLRMIRLVIGVRSSNNNSFRTTIKDL